MINSSDETNIASRGVAEGGVQKALYAPPIPLQFSVGKAKVSLVNDEIFIMRLFCFDMLSA